ncbi:hypothetical protein BT69DRAFT_557379 [Atractiella rhizophila]|nr:hypothetical protein BT69DRAFT_557379 [Atractiella rhizophila]
MNTLVGRLAINVTRRSATHSAPFSAVGCHSLQSVKCQRPVRTSGVGRRSSIQSHLGILGCRRSSSFAPISPEAQDNGPTIPKQPTFVVLEEADLSDSIKEVSEVSSTDPEPSESSSSSSTPTPWFVDTSYLPSSSLASKSIPTPPIALPSNLEPLHDQLCRSAFLDSESVAFTKKDGEWRAIACMKEGREGGVRAAIGETAAWMRKNPEAPYSRNLRISGLASRRGSGSTDWAIIDTGYMTVHIMTVRARMYYDLDGWSERATEEERLAWDIDYQ